ncbi:hypothetical protein AD24_4842 [Escherichia coli 2-011-08_S4_C3]|nr:hypothetical protein AD24_4842 [Escherichia coli 2-011-08_S4_C3]
MLDMSRQHAELEGWYDEVCEHLQLFAVHKQQDLLTQIALLQKPHRHFLLEQLFVH